MRIPVRGSLILLAPLLFGVGCTVGVGDNSGDTVQVTVRGQYEKRPITTTGFGAPVTLPTRYGFAEIREQGSNRQLATLDLDGSGQGTINVTRGANIYAVIYADVLVPSADGKSTILHGNVKKAIPKTSYATGQDLENEVTWGTSSSSVSVSSNGTLTVKALESTSEAGAFAIADQMVAFAQGITALEPNLPLPNFHAFWTSNTVSTYPVAAATSNGSLVRNPTTNRPMLVNEFWYGGPSNMAEAYNDGLLLETFSRGLSAYGSYWTTTSYSSLIRGDNDAAWISPWISSEPTLAFTSGFATFLSGALRNDPNVITMFSDGTLDHWSLATHDFTPTDGGEFYASSIARAQWGTWKNVLSGGTSGLTTLWNATTANQVGEINNAPLGCYPTYLAGLKRMVGALTYVNVQTQLNAENIGKGLDVTSFTYLNGTTLWTDVAPTPTPISGTLVTYNNALSQYSGAYYDRVQAKTYRVVFGDGNHTLSLTTTSPGMIVELFDNIGLYTTLYATPSQSATKTLALTAGTYAVRVRVDPIQTYNGTPAPYSLMIN